MSEQKSFELDEVQENLLSSGIVHRRKFMSYLGLGASALTIGLAACKKESSATSSSQNPGALAGATKKISGDCQGIDLGSGDIGILNYAYALEQLEAAFYTQVFASFYSGGTAWEKELLSQIRDHEIAHREFFKTALGSSAIQALTPDFSSIDFTSRASVLGAAKAFEDTGVTAYDGAAQLITTPLYLTLAAKIVSVEARHAAYIRELLSPNSFADNTVVDSNGLNMVNTPAAVIDIANMYLTTKICGNNLPTS